MSFNLATILRESRLAQPDKPLCHIGDLTFTYAQVDEISGRVATSLRALGLERGDKVAVQLPNLPQFLFTYFGILKAGLVMVPLNPLLRAPEITYHLQDSDARLLVTFEMFAEEAVKGASPVEGDDDIRRQSARQRAAARRHQALRRAVLRGRHRRDRAHQRRRHRGDHLHQRDDGQAEGRGAHPLPDLHELHGRGRAVRIPRRRHRRGRAAAVPRVRAVQRAQCVRAIQRHAGAHPAVRTRRGPRRDRAVPLHDLLRRPDHVLRAAASRYLRPRPVGAAGRCLRWRGDSRRGHPRVRGEVPRRGHPRGLRAVGDGEHDHVQHQRRAAQGALHRQADLGRGDAHRRRATTSRCRPAPTTSARSSSAATT